MEESKSSVDKSMDIIARIIEIYSKGKYKKQIQSESPFSKVLSMTIPDYLGVIDGHVKESGAMINYNQQSRVQDLLTRARQGIKIGDI